MTHYERLRARIARTARLEKPDANAGRIAKNTVVLYFRMLAVMFVGLFTNRIQLQALGVTDLGLYNVATGVVAMFVFLNGSLSMASSRFLVVEMGKGTIGSLKRVFSTVFFVHMILALGFVVVLETVGLYFLSTKLNIDPSRISAVKWVFQCAVATTFLSVTQVPYSAVIVAHERMSAFAYMAVYDVVVKLAIAYGLLASSGDRLKLYAVLLLLSSFVTISIYRLYCVRNFTEARIRKVFDFKLLAPIFSFAGWHIATQTVIMLLTQGVLMLNQRYFGPALVAALSIAQSVNLHVQGFINNFKTAANPQIIKLYSSGQLEEAKRLLIETVLFSVFILLVLGVPIWFYSTELMTLWLGNNVPQYSPVMVKIILAGAFFSVFDTSLYVILYAAGRIKENMWFNVILGGSAFVAIYLMIHFTHNPLSSCIVLAVHQVMLGIVAKPILLHLIARYTMSDFLRILVPSLKAFLACVLIAAYVRSVMPVNVFWVVPACGLIAIMSALAIFGFAASKAMRCQAIRFSERMPLVGRYSSVMLGRMEKIIERFRDA